jgi:hypothetical protein
MKHLVTDVDAGVELVQPDQRLLPGQLPGRARRLLRELERLMGPTGAIPARGAPASAMTTIVDETDIDERNVRTALRQLEDAQLVITYRTPEAGQHGPGPLRINVLGSIRIENTCEECGAATQSTGRWCEACKQRFRSDREWQLCARFLARSRGFEPGRIAAILDRPLYVASEQDGRSANGGAVVPYLLGQRLLGAEWMERLREALQGAGSDDA